MTKYYTGGIFVLFVSVYNVYVYPESLIRYLCRPSGFHILLFNYMSVLYPESLIRYL